MRIAYTTYSARAWTIEQHVRMARETGCQGLELRTLANEPIGPELPPAERRRIMDLCADAELEICAVGSDCRLANLDPDERRAQIERGLGFIELADEWSAPVVRVFGGRHEPDLDPAEVNGWVAEALRELAEPADQLGIQVAIETHDDFSAGARVADVVERANHLGSAVVWDLGHPYRVGEAVEQTWGLIGPHVAHVHFKDIKRTGQGPTGWGGVPAGAGDLPLEQMIELLADDDYDGFISTEWERRVDPVADDPAIALPQHTKLLRELIERARG